MTINGAPVMAVPSNVPTLIDLSSFNDSNGASPQAGLIADASGDLFGTTVNGGANGDGTVFEITDTANGYASTPTTLANFNGSNGAHPYGSLFVDASGDLFGTTEIGGAAGVGTVFEIANTQSGYASTPMTLASFSQSSNGSYPLAGLIADANGDLFGTTNTGGANGDGTVFEIANTANGYASTPTPLVSFNGANGALPYGGLVADASGDLFGTTQRGGVDGVGTVFEIANTSNGYASTPTTLVNFTGSNGAYPFAGLVADANGDLFGTTYIGGANGDGTVFEIANAPNGYASTPTTLVSFNNYDGSNPTAGLIVDANGDLFGTTAAGGKSGAGTIFEIAKTASGYAGTPLTLFNFNGPDGSYPSVGLISDANGDLFGATDGGGTNADGTLYEFSQVAQTLGVGEAAQIAGLSLSESGNTTGETFTVTLSDTNGELSASNAGGASVSPTGTTLTIVGSVSQVNAALATLADADPVVGSDTISVKATDGFGNAAAQQTFAVMVNGTPVVAVPGAQTLAFDQPTTIAGISLSESGNTAGESFTVTLSDTNGVLSASTAGDATVSSSNAGTTLTVAGSLTEVNAALATVADTDAVAGADSITVNAVDSFGNTQTQSQAGYDPNTIAVMVDPVPPGAPLIASVTDHVLPILGTVYSGGATNDPSPQVRINLALSSGMALAGDQVELFNGDTLLDSVTLTNNDILNNVVDLYPELANNTTYVLTAKVVDFVGNVGPASAPYTITEEETPAAPALSVPSTLVVNEDGAVSLPISVTPWSLSDPVEVTINGIPSNASLSDNGGALTVVNGSVVLTPDQLAGLTLTAGLPTTANLTVTAFDEAGATSSTSQSVALRVNPVAPTIAMSTANVSVEEYGSVELPVSVIPFDPNDSVEVEIKYLPTGDTLSDGEGDTFVGGNPVNMSLAQFDSGLTLTVGPAYAGRSDTFGIAFQATNVAGASSPVDGLAVTVYEAPPVLGGATSVTVEEGGAFTLGATDTTTFRNDTLGDVTITGLPNDLTNFNGGTYRANGGTWTGTAAQFGALSFNAGGAGNYTLAVSATTVYGIAPATENYSLTVEPLPPILSGATSTIVSSASLPVNLGVTDSAVFPDDALGDVTITGLPNDLHGFNGGTYTLSDGSWTGTAQQFNALSFYVSGNPGSFDLSITAGLADSTLTTQENYTLNVLPPSGYAYNTLTDPDAFYSRSSPAAVAGQGTFVTAINDSNEAVGYYFDGGGADQTEGFIWSNGSYTTIDDPNAGNLYPSLTDNNGDPVQAPGTMIAGINNAGVIVGNYYNGDFYSNVNYPTYDVGFVDVNGQFSDILDPNANSWQGTVVKGINDNNQIFGYYYDQHSATHGFIESNGNYTTLDAPLGSNTQITGINDAGVIVGDYTTSNGNGAGFIDVNNQFTSIQYPGAQGTYVAGINNNDVVVGYYFNGTLNGFMEVDGYYTTINDPGGSQTELSGINDGGTVVGSYLNPSFGSLGLLASDPPDVPGLTWTDTNPISINAGTTTEISMASTGAATFSGSNGTLQLDQSASFTGTISGFGHQDQLDLGDIAFGAGTTLGYAANNGNTGGTLTISDGTHTANLALLGQYAAASFVVASDGHGGTLVTDPPPVAQAVITQPQHA